MSGNPRARPQYHSNTLRVAGIRIRLGESALMNCSDLLARFTDYLDGSASEVDVALMEEHLEGCPACGRYKVVLEHGANLLRDLPEPEIREDFGQRLQHRLYHVDDERALSAHAGSGAPALTVLGIAVLLTAVAWSPAFFARAPVVHLAPIVVDRAPTRSLIRPASATPPGTFSTKGEADLGEGLWANTLLYDYSPLSQRYDPRARKGRRIGQVDR